MLDAPCVCFFLSFHTRMVIHARVSSQSLRHVQLARRRRAQAPNLHSPVGAKTSKAFAINGIVVLISTCAPVENDARLRGHHAARRMCPRSVQWTQGALRTCTSAHLTMVLAISGVTVQSCKHARAQAESATPLVYSPSAFKSSVYSSVSSMRRSRAIGTPLGFGRVSGNMSWPSPHRIGM